MLQSVQPAWTTQGRARCRGGAGSWRAFALAALAVALALLGALEAARADDSNVVPAEIQAELLAKLMGYDRTFAARAGGTARVLLVVKAHRVRSELSAAEMKSALGRIDRLGGLPHEETVFPYDGPNGLVAYCGEHRIAAVYITPGFEDDLAEVRASLSNVNVLSVAAVPEYVPQGIVLGFELAKGKPKILLNLRQARLQGLDFSADVLRLMKVYQ